MRLCVRSSLQPPRCITRLALPLLKEICEEEGNVSLHLRDSPSAVRSELFTLPGAGLWASGPLLFPVSRPFFSLFRSVCDVASAVCLIFFLPTVCLFSMRFTFFHAGCKLPVSVSRYVTVLLFQVNTVQLFAAHWPACWRVSSLAS